MLATVHAGHGACCSIANSVCGCLALQSHKYRLGLAALCVAQQQRCYGRSYQPGRVALHDA